MKEERNMAKEIKARKPGEHCGDRCRECPYFCGRKGDLVLCLNPEVTGMERIPTPVRVDAQHPCPYQAQERWNF